MISTVYLTQSVISVVKMVYVSVELWLC